MTDLATPLARVIAQVESSTWPWAVRFEPAVFASQPMVVTAIAVANRCSQPTAKVFYAMSFGLFQIMGLNLWSWMGWKESAGAFLADAESQLEMFNLYCTRNGVDPNTFNFADDAAIQHFAKIYNGPGAIADYSAKMKAAFAALPPVAT